MESVGKAARGVSLVGRTAKVYLQDSRFHEKIRRRRSPEEIVIVSRPRKSFSRLDRISESLSGLG